MICSALAVFSFENENLIEGLFSGEFLWTKIASERTRAVEEMGLVAREVQMAVQLDFAVARRRDLAPCIENECIISAESGMNKCRVGQLACNLYGSCA